MAVKQRYTPYQLFLLGIGISLYLILTFLTISQVLSIEAIPIISNIYEAIKGPGQAKTAGAVITSLLTGGALIAVGGGVLSWFGKFFQNRRVAPLSSPIIYTPQFQDFLKEQHREIDAPTQALHEASLVDHPHQLKPHSKFKAGGSSLYHFKNETPELFAIKASDRKNNYMLGKGNYGIVKKYLASTGKTVAIKTIAFMNNTPKIVDDFHAEVLALRALDRLHGFKIVDVHPQRYKNSGNLEGFYKRKGYIATDYYQGEMLENIVYDCPHIRITPDQCIHLMAMMLKEVQLLHSKGLLHNDIKPQNFMIISNQSKWDEARLIDFGAARAINQPSATLSVDFAPPELGSWLTQYNFDLPRTIQMDIYAIGNTFQEMLDKTDNPPQALVYVVNSMHSPHINRRPGLAFVQNSLEEFRTKPAVEVGPVQPISQ